MYQFKWLIKIVVHFLIYMINRLIKQLCRSALNVYKEEGGLDIQLRTRRPL